MLDARCDVDSDACLLTDADLDQLADDFVQALFTADTENQWPLPIRNLLTAALLRHYDDFIYIILQHPADIYKDNSRWILPGSGGASRVRSGGGRAARRIWARLEEEGWFD